MTKRILILIFLFVSCNLFLVTSVKADGEFDTSYNVTYEVSEDGTTQVTEGISLKNLTDRFYASNFSLVISATELSDIQALDSRGNLPVQTTIENQKTRVDVQFTNQQITGKGRQYDWTLKFKSKDFAQKLNKVWQVTIPKVASLKDVSTYNLALIIPVGFGDPTSTLPEPKSQSENSGKILFHYNKDQLAQSGVVANFGNIQIVNFDLDYSLSNYGLLPSIKKVSLPADTSYQEILINNIVPEPENVYQDQDGNFVALFKVDRGQKITAKVLGTGKLYIKNTHKGQLSEIEQKKYTASEKYWDKDNPIIKTKLSEIFNGKNPTTNQEKAHLTYNFVVNNLSFDLQRAREQNYQRLGGLTVLNNPDKALSAEFVDLFITLTRAAGVPSRMLVGYAYSSNSVLRPFTFEGENLHTWAEYYDPGLGWVMVDPAWDNASGGVDYFSQFDPNHLVIATRGLLSEEPQVPNKANISYNGDNFERKYGEKLEISAPSQIYASFPTQAKVKFKNIGNSATSSANLSISASRIQIPGEKTKQVPATPPFGSASYNFDLRTASVFDSFEDVLQVKLGNLLETKLIIVQPFFSYKYFAPIVVSFLTFMIIIYGVILAIHLKPSLLKKKAKK